MRLTCPFCGDRVHSEFTYLGDATAKRPNGDEDNVLERFIDAVYSRDNPAGPMKELWYHGGGCRRWLSVTRDTRTHAILAVSMTRNASE